MIFLTTVKNAILEVISGKKLRTITATLFGPNDVKNYPESGPAGYDGSPITGLTAVFAKTNKSSASVFIGYVPTNQLSQPGESRIYATDANGVEKTRVWCHNDGTVELGGTGSAGSNTNHATQYEALALAITNYFVAQNTAITTGVASAGGAYTPPATIDLTGAKLNKLLVE